MLFFGIQQYSQGQSFPIRICLTCPAKHIYCKIPLVQDRKRSDSMRPACNLMRLDPVMRRSISLIRGVDIVLTEELFCVTVVSILSILKIAEQYDSCPSLRETPWSSELSWSVGTKLLKKFIRKSSNPILTKHFACPFHFVASGVMQSCVLVIPLAVNNI